MGSVRTNVRTDESTKKGKMNSLLTTQESRRGEEIQINPVGGRKSFKR